MSDKKVSVYASIAEDILNKIKSNVYPIDSFLPPERELMELYKVQRTTVRRGLELLHKDGYIKKAAGLGSIVKSKKPVTNAEAKNPSEVTVKVIKQVSSVKDTDNLSVLVPTMDTEALPKPIVDILSQMGKAGVYITENAQSVDNDGNVIVMAQPNESLKSGCCLALCQSDDYRSVILDSDKAAYTALTYLEELGHTSFAYIGTDSSYAFENAFSDSFSAVNSYPDEELITLSGRDEKAGFDGFSELFRRHGDKFTAVCTVNDEVARGVLKAAKYYKVKVPEELSVISLCSFDKANDIDAVYFDIKELADEILESAQRCKRVATVLFGGTLKIKGSCSRVKTQNNSGKNISSFLL